MRWRSVAAANAKGLRPLPYVAVSAPPRGPRLPNQRLTRAFQQTQTLLQRQPPVEGPLHPKTPSMARRHPLQEASHLRPSPRLQRRRQMRKRRSLPRPKEAHPLWATPRKRRPSNRPASEWRREDRRRKCITKRAIHWRTEREIRLVESLSLAAFAYSSRSTCSSNCRPTISQQLIVSCSPLAIKSLRMSRCSASSPRLVSFRLASLCSYSCDFHSEFFVFSRCLCMYCCFCY